MTVRNTTTCAIGFAVALSLAATTPSAAQTDTTRARRDSIRADSIRRVTSQQRIRLGKERVRTSPGEVVTPRDTMPVKTDTAAVIVRTDTTTVITRTDTVKTDTAVAAPTPPPPPPPEPEQLPTVRPMRGIFGNGFYIGVAGGAAIPTSDLNAGGYEAGFNVEVPIGFHPLNSPFGVRLNLGYNKFKGFLATVGQTNFDNPDPDVFSAALDGVLRFPFNYNRTNAFYVAGGGGLHMFRNFGAASFLGTRLGDDIIEDTDEPPEKNVTKWGVHGGAGFEFGVGAASLFIESRLVNTFIAGRDARWVPVVVGVTFR